MIATVITFFLSNYAFTFFLIGVLCACGSLLRHRRTIDAARAFEVLLSFYVLFPIGLHFLYNFVMHVFFSERAAAFIGWQASPFQKEVGFASLGFGVIGVLACRGSFGLRFSAVTGPAFFLWGAAGGHAYQMVANHNFSPGNAGMVFWTDILLPVVGFVLLLGWRKTDGAVKSPAPPRILHGAR